MKNRKGPATPITRSAAKLTFVVLCICVGMALAQTERVLHSFQGGNDGATPTAALISDAQGNLYGTTTGFNFQGGTVFKLTRPVAGGGGWTEAVLHNFPADSSDGRAPQAGLIFDRAGNLYGTTSYGGASNAGIVFELSPPSTTGGPWTETVLHAFTGVDGYIGGGLIFAGPTFGNRVLYGTTLYGGKAGAGNFYGLAHPVGGPWKDKVFYTFTGKSDGLEANYGCDALVADTSGNFYGVTAFGGAFSGGVVFQMSPPATQSGAWTETVLYNFGATPTDAQVPVSGLALDANGNLYGTTNGGGQFGNGTVFELTPPAVSGEAWTESVIYSFANGSDGSTPWGTVIFDRSGNLLGTTLTGSVYKLTPPASVGGPWTETSIYNFPGHSGDGSEPEAGVIVDAQGNLYGTTATGGASNNGTVYEIRP